MASCLAILKVDAISAVAVLACRRALRDWNDGPAIEAMIPTSATRPQVRGDSSLMTLKVVRPLHASIGSWHAPVFAIPDSKTCAAHLV
jgi:hypothetical protein